MLACGAEGMPLDALTAARLARDGERPRPCATCAPGQHAVFILLAKLGGWELETYWQDDHPAQAAVREAIGAAFAVDPGRIRTGIDGCGILTYAFPLREVARAFAILADPEALPAGDPRTALAPSLLEVRDAMLAYPDLVGGTRDRLDTSLMKAADGRCVSKGGAEGLRGIGILRGPRNGAEPPPASGMAIKIEDGDGHDRGPWARDRRGAAPGRRPRGPGTPRARPLPPAGRARPARPPGRRVDRGVRARARGRAGRPGDVTFQRGPAS